MIYYISINLVPITAKKDTLFQRDHDFTIHCSRVKSLEAILYLMACPLIANIEDPPPPSGNCQVMSVVFLSLYFSGSPWVKCTTSLDSDKHNKEPEFFDKYATERWEVWLIQPLHQFEYLSLVVIINYWNECKQATRWWWCC